MVRRKEVRKAGTAATRSTASIFHNIDSAENLDEKPTVDDKTTQHEQPEDPDRPQDYKFPFNLIFEFQDFLNLHLTFCRGVELLVILYLCQVFYLYLSEGEEYGGLTAIGFCVVGAVLAMYLSTRSLRKRHEANPENVAKPALPEFNTIYGFFIPTAFSVLLGGTTTPFFQMNLAIINFCVHTLHPVAKVVSSFVFYYMYNENETLQVFEFLLVVWIYFSVDWALNYWNEGADEAKEVRPTLSATEIHLIAVFFVNILFNFYLTVSDTHVPLLIVRALVIALVGATAALFPVYYVTSSLSNPVFANLAAVVVATVFSSVFYYLTNYIFTTHIINEEVISWLYNYIASSELRVRLLAVWLVAIGVAIPIVFALAEFNIVSLNFRRKAWHYILFASLAYPALVKEPVFTAIAVLGSVFVFIVVEFVRASRLGWLGSFLDTHLRYFQDEKDANGPLNLSYIFLLVGVAIPIAYGLAVDDVVSIRSYIGLITLGLSDSTASIVGRAFGKIKWKGGNRTLEGTITHIVVTFASFAVVDRYLLPEESKVKNWENLVIVSILGGLVEGASTLNDNILVPTMTLIAYEVIRGVFPDN